MRTIRIKKGVDLYVNERDKFNTAIFQVDFVFPTDAHLFARLNLLSDLLKKHSAKFQMHQQIIDFLEEHYGAVLNVDYDFFGNYSTFSLMISFVHPSLLKDKSYRFSDLVSFIDDLIFNQNDRVTLLFDNEKKYCKNLLRDELTDPQTLVFYQALPRYISSTKLNSPLSGTFTQLNAADMNQVYDLWQNLIQTSAINIYYDGYSLSLEERKVINQFADRFFARNQVRPSSIYYLEKNKSQKMFYENRRTFRQHLFLQQYYLAENAKYRSGNYASWLVFNQIFGGDSESFLFQRIREDLHLSYEAFSHLSFGLNSFFVYATLNSLDFEIVDREIGQLFEAIQNQNYSQKSLDIAKKTLVNQLLYQNDGRFFDISQQKMKFIIPNYLSNAQLIKEIEAVNPDDLTLCVQNVQPGVKMWYEGMQ